MFPPNTSHEELMRASKMFDLAPQMPPVDWSQALRHLPEMDIIKAVNGPPESLLIHGSRPPAAL